LLLGKFFHCGFDLLAFWLKIKLQLVLGKNRG